MNLTPYNDHNTIDHQKQSPHNKTEHDTRGPLNEPHMDGLPQKSQMLRQHEIYQPHNHDIWKERVVFEKSRECPCGYLLDGDPQQNTQTPQRTSDHPHLQVNQCLQQEQLHYEPPLYQPLYQIGDRFERV